MSDDSREAVPVHRTPRWIRLLKLGVAMAAGAFALHLIATKFLGLHTPH